MVKKIHYQNMIKKGVKPFGNLFFLIKKEGCADY